MFSPHSAAVPRSPNWDRLQEGRWKATWKREFNLLLREAGPPNHHDDKEDSDQQVVNEELPLCDRRGSSPLAGPQGGNGNVHQSSRGLRAGLVFVGWTRTGVPCS